MTISDLKEALILPKEEFPINQSFSYKGNDIYLLSFIRSEGANTLWALIVGDPIDIDDLSYIYHREEITNREFLSRNHEYISEQFSISQIKIQKQLFTIATSFMGKINTNDYTSVAMLQHFMEKGLIPPHLERINTNKISIASYTQQENEPFPTININAPLNIEIFIDHHHDTFMINQPIIIGYTEESVQNKYSFIHPLTKEKVLFYLDPLSHYSQQTLIIYEVPEKLSLQFYTKAYLNALVNHTNKSASSTILFAKGTPPTREGYRKIPQILKNIPVGDTIDVELFSVTIVHPKKTIKLY